MRRCGDYGLALTQRLLVAPLLHCSPLQPVSTGARIGGGAGRLRPEGQHGAGKQRRPGWPETEGWTFHTYAALRPAPLYLSSPPSRGFPLLLRDAKSSTQEATQPHSWRHICQLIRIMSATSSYTHTGSIRHTKSIFHSKLMKSFFNFSKTKLTKYSCKK